MESFTHVLIQVRIRIAKNDPDRTSDSFNFGIIFVRDLMVGNKSSFKRKKAARALGVASNCWYSRGKNSFLTSASLKNLPTCH